MCRWLKAFPGDKKDKIAKLMIKAAKNIDEFKTVIQENDISSAQNIMDVVNKRFTFAEKLTGGIWNISPEQFKEHQSLSEISEQPEQVESKSSHSVVAVLKVKEILDMLDSSHLQISERNRRKHSPKYPYGVIFIIDFEEVHFKNLLNLKTLWKIKMYFMKRRAPF
uniref:Uncharacterized protein n=1 Tax=Ditylenchus dipsaci TaxID=166011 RepID=A0A915DW48_9BILA